MSQTRWALKPGHEMSKYLGLDKTEEPAPEGEKQADITPQGQAGPFGLKPPAGLLKYLETNSNKPETKGKPANGRKSGNKPAEKSTPAQSGSHSPDEYVHTFEKWHGWCKNKWVQRITDEIVDDLPIAETIQAYDAVKSFGPLPSTISDVITLLDSVNTDYAEDAGLFASYCLNEVCPESEIELRIKRQFHFLGAFNNGKRWIIRGNTGKNTGFEMSQGELVVYGNVDYDVGLEMTGGKITVEGDSDFGAGSLMRGGELHLNGRINSCIATLSSGGNICHKGKLLYKDGREV